MSILILLLVRGVALMEHSGTAYKVVRRVLAQQHRHPVVLVRV